MTVPARGHRRFRAKTASHGLSRGYRLNLIARARGFVRARARDGAQDRFFSSLSNLIEPELRGTGGFR